MSATSPPSARSMALSVVVATHNRAALLEETLRALMAQATPADLRWEIVVVDNRSTDGTRPLVERMAALSRDRIRYVFAPRLGKSVALNIGIEAARGAVLALTDDDVSPAVHWVATAAKVLDRWDAAGAGGRILPRWEAQPPSWLLRNQRLLDHLAIMEFDRPAVLPVDMVGPPPPPQVWGANMIFRRAALRSLGGFDLTLGPVGRKRYCEEDCDIVRRMLRGGYRVVYDPELTVFHRIPRARLRRGYFRRVVWHKAEGEALRAPAPRGAGLFGAPRWRYRRVARMLVQSALRRMAGRPGAFDELLDSAEELGALWGHLKRAWREHRSHGAKAQQRAPRAVVADQAPR
jgi:glycosyltransferase involved in cell wall biosynthesis